MLRGMTVRQFQEWRAYADLEPFDETRADLRSADIVRTLLNLFGRGKGKPAFPLKDCVLRFGADRGNGTKKVTPQEARAQVLRTMQILMAIHNAPRRAAPKPVRKRDA
jgi:hypothetical protein